MLFFGVFLSATTAPAQTPNATIENGNDEVRLQTFYNGGLLAPGTIVVDGTETDSIPAEGAGTRLMWYPEKAAFRAGRVGAVAGNENLWDASNVGVYSVAFGVDTEASGEESTAMGEETTASGEESTAMGDETTASDLAATAMGELTTASGDRSTAMGYETTASGQYSTAMGFSTVASGGTSTAMGYETTASGDRSTAMGLETTASARQSTAMGDETTAATSSSLTIGRYNSANTSDDNSLFVAGNGSFNNRSDAMVLKKSGDLAVGPSDPSVRFEVTKDKSNQGVADNPTGNIALIRNTNSGSDPDVLGLQAGPPNPSSGTTYLSFYDRDGTTVGAIEGNGSGGIDITGNGADFAEELPVAEKAEAPEPAEIVGVRGGTVSLRAEGADRVMIASTAPIMTGNAAPSSGPDAEEGRRVEVAFVGQVPAKVRGSVDRGDLIVASGQDDGTAQAVSPDEYRRADHGPVAGQAWSSKSAEGIGEVTVAVGLGRSGAVAERLEAQQSQIDSLEEKVRQIATMKDRLAALEAEASAAPATAGPMGSPAGSWGLALLLGLGGLAGGILWRRRS
jgi:hypothetical protein